MSAVIDHSRVQRDTDQDPTQYKIIRHPNRGEAERSMEWFYARDRKQIGPISEQEFSILVQLNQITASTLVWRPGMENWTKFELIAEAAGFPEFAADKNSEPAAEPQPNPADPWTDPIPEENPSPPVDSLPQSVETCNSPSFRMRAAATAIDGAVIIGCGIVIRLFANWIHPFFLFFVLLICFCFFANISIRKHGTTLGGRISRFLHSRFTASSAPLSAPSGKCNDDEPKN